MSLKAHIDNWISKSELDYYIMFIKAWIPLNAWFYNEYSTKNDSEALNALKNSKNIVRNRIETLLKNDDPICKKFRQNLAELHVELENRSVLNYGKVITFTSIILEGRTPVPVTATDSNGNIYKAIPDKVNGYKAIVTNKNNKTIMDKTFNPYDINKFLTENQYVAISDRKIQAKIKACFIDIDPNKPIDLTSKSKNKLDYIELDPELKIKFVNDTELIAKGLIQILYALRCVLFHGELNPTESNQAIYEHAYHILKPIIKELK